MQSVVGTWATGEVSTHWEYDPTYEPPMPRGAVRGDVLAQQFCTMCHVPKYFYVDEPKRCVQCDSDFVFTAAEQKFWFETLKFNFSSTAIRCRACRKKRRSASAVGRQLADAVVAATASPDDAGVLLALAEATLHQAERSGSANFNRALAGVRHARRLVPGLHEALYWEARCHAAAGRAARAREAFQAFIVAAANSARTGKLVRHARAELLRLDA